MKAVDSYVSSKHSLPALFSVISRYTVLSLALSLTTRPLSLLGVKTPVHAYKSTHTLSTTESLQVQVLDPTTFKQIRFFLTKS